MTEDTKLIAGVAAVVIAGAAGIAFLASMSASREAEVQNRVSRPESVLTTAMPASFPATEQIESVVQEVEPVDEPFEFKVRPGEDCVAGGLEAWNTGDYPKAAAYFETEAAGRPEGAWIHYMLGLSLWKDGRLEEAVEAMERCAEIDGSSVKTMVNLSRIKNDLGDFEGALQAAEAALLIDDGSAKAHFLVGRSLRNLGRHAEAVDSLEKSIEIDPDDGYVHNLLGLTLLQMDRETEAVVSLESAAELQSEVAYIHNNLGMAYERCGNRQEAIHAYNRAAALDNGQGKGALNLARLGIEFVPPAEIDETAKIEVASAAEQQQAVSEESNGL